MAQDLKDYDIMDIEAMDDERLEKSSTGRIYVTRVYIKDEVDAVLAEKDAEIRRLKRVLWLARAERADDRARIFYFNDLETMLDIDGFSYDRKKKKGCKKLTALHWRIIWLKVERKCRAKAEEYK